MVVNVSVLAAAVTAEGDLEPRAGLKAALADNHTTAKASCGSQQWAWYPGCRMVSCLGCAKLTQPSSLSWRLSQVLLTVPEKGLH